MTSTYATWGKSRVKLTWEQGPHLPDVNRITSVHGFCFHKGKILLVNLHKRGWDFPGGHIETGESPKDCLNREAMEEGYVSGPSNLLGTITVDHHDNPYWNEESPYPKVGYQVFYKMEVETIHLFGAQYESDSRCWIEPGSIGDYYPSWNGLYQEILSLACKGGDSL
ncbi:NUDIX hydrolase [Bacillus sp. KH172YL63]|uniref:NUDIX hydrolase n=1 Tax=Bacillus sp. KH172YL63 TaxID=2709784 RepID=UPI0013E4ECD7|nr:NUDIX domain-containing protein [Bacillus sp. KH172YL63]BCB03683.1 hypothetical protein KH172YL63_18160 [Bacillus sp. KH172YL63]